MNHNEYVKQWRLENLEERRAYDRKWYRKNRARIKEAKRLWREANRAKVLLWQKISERKRRLRRETEKYGVVRPKTTFCGICRRRISGHQINLDHDHETERFRGWLCLSCNVLLGFYEQVLKNSRFSAKVKKYLGGDSTK